MSDYIIENVPLTKEWLAEVIEKKLGVKPKIGTSGILDNSDLGYMSMIRKVQLYFNEEQEENHPHLPKQVVLKVPCCSKGTNVIENAGVEAVSSDQNSVVEQTMHNTECDYYQMFAKQSEKPLKIPLIYAANKIGDGASPVPVIVMEMFEDCKVYDIIEGFNEEQLYKIVDEIVKLHIFSLTTEEWKKIISEDRSSMSNMFQIMVKSIADNLAKQPGLEIVATFTRNVLDNNPNFLQSIEDEYASEKRPSVVTHGDLWAPQILWDKKDNIAAIIDWQLSHRGSPMEDLHHILSTCTTVENRLKLTKPLLCYYFDKLNSGLEAKGVKNPWTKEDIDEEFKHNMLQSAAFTIFSNGFWANSPILQTDGKPDVARITESFSRCRSYLEEVVNVHNMS